MEAKVWLQKLIRMRKAIIRLQRSHKGKADCEFLERHLAAYNYTDRTFAAFFVRHSDKIYGILPGKGSRSQKRFEQQFSHHLEQCNNKSRMADHSHAPL